MKKFASAVVIAIGFALSGFFIGHAISNVKALDRYVTVKGLASKTVKANHAIWQIQFTYANNNLDALYQGVSGAQHKLKTFLQAQGFAANAISLQPISVTDNQSSSYNPNKNAKRYVAEGGVIVSTNNVDSVNQAMQNTGKLVQAGVVVTNSSVRYLFTELNQIKPQMLDQATANAALAAQSFASNSHSKLGSIRHASQGLFTIKDANNTYDNGTSIMKQVRVVTTVQYFLVA